MIDLGRIPVLRKFVRPRPRKNFLMALWDEANRNLERYYVVEQRQFITEPFDIEAVEEARLFAGMSLPPELYAYVDAIREFNAALQDVKAFEESYSASIDKKTRDNAEVLHLKKEALAEKFQVLRPIILSAYKISRELLARYRSG